MTLKIRLRSPLPLLPTMYMYLCRFGQNPSTGSEDNARKPYFGHFSASVTLKIRLRSLKSGQLFPLLPTMYMCQFGQNPSTSSEDNAQKPYFGHSKCHCDLENKVKTRSSKSCQLLPSSQQCIYTSLVKIHQPVQKIMHGNESKL